MCRKFALGTTVIVCLQITKTNFWKLNQLVLARSGERLECHIANYTIFSELCIFACILEGDESGLIPPRSLVPHGHVPHHRHRIHHRHRQHHCPRLLHLDLAMAVAVVVIIIISPHRFFDSAS